MGDKCHVEGFRECKVCTKTYYKKYGMGNFKCETCRGYEKYHRYKDKNRHQQRAASLKYRTKNIEKVTAKEKDRNRNRDHLKERYGLTREDYNLMLSKQDGCCAICKGTEDKSRVRNLFYIDHDHETGKIRQLLCRGCNVGLGHFKDNSELLLKASVYLKAHGK